MLMDMWLEEKGICMIEAAFVKAAEGVLWSAYIGAGGVAAVQLRQLVSGGFELRSGGSEIWKAVSS